MLSRLLNNSTDALACFIIILRVDLLDVLNVFDELLVVILARLDREVGDVSFDRLHISLDKAVDLNKGKERAKGDTAHVHYKSTILLADSDDLLQEADFEQTLV